MKMKRYKCFFIGILVSLILFIFFAYLHCTDTCWTCILGLDIKWLIIASIPILIGLFLGGHIKSFKGFGIELEANLHEEIPKDLITKADINNIISIEERIGKNNESYINTLSEYERKSITGLKMTLGKRNYYNEDVLDEYFRRLPNLNYIEIIDRNGKFRYLLPISKLDKRKYNRDNIDYNLLYKLIEAVEKNAVMDFFPYIIDDYILVTDKLIDTYNKLSYSSQSKYLFQMAEVLPVLSNDHKMIGLISKLSLTDKITKDLINKIEN